MNTCIARTIKQIKSDCGTDFEGMAVLIIHDLFTSASQLPHESDGIEYSPLQMKHFQIVAVVKCCIHCGCFYKEGSM